MKLFLGLITICSISGILFSSCEKENEEDLQGDTIYCLDTNVSFANNVMPILQNNCWECHSTAVAQNGIILDTYQDVVDAITAGYVIPQINRDAGAAQMPFGRPKLKDCVIATIEQWVAEGMQNN